MKLRHTTTPMSDKVEMQMTPMIDIVFLLLIFFLFSFKFYIIYACIFLLKNFNNFINKFIVIFLI